MNTAQAIRHSNRVRELNKMSKGELDAVRRRRLAEQGMKVIWEAGRPSKDELISEILDLEGLRP